jgi:hypothetical protein
MGRCGWPRGQGKQIATRAVAMGLVGVLAMMLCACVESATISALSDANFKPRDRQLKSGLRRRRPVHGTKFTPLAALDEVRPIEVARGRLRSAAVVSQRCHRGGGSPASPNRVDDDHSIGNTCVVSTQLDYPSRLR